MRHTWDRAFADGREAALAGEGPERLLDACGRLLLPGADVGALVEMPLLGAPSYDFLLVVHGMQAEAGRRLGDPAQTKAQSVVDWLAGIDGPRPEAFLELDASGQGRLAGAHAKIEGRLDLAEGFFSALGEPMRMEPLREVVGRLPHGWLCLYVASFPGREQGCTRLEVVPSDEAARASMGDVGLLARNLDRIGFSAYDGTVLEDVARLVGVGTPVTMQFDLLPEGTLSPAVSLVSSYEHARGDVRSLWRPEGELSRACRLYEEMGLADDRWRMLDGACFIARRTTLAAEGVRADVHGCLPNCTKLTWEGGVRGRAKVYMDLGRRRLRPRIMA